MDENKRLRKEAAKKEKKMEKLAAYAFHRFNSLVAETKNLANLYSAARANTKDGVVLPELDKMTADEKLGGSVFEKMYADLEKPAAMEESSSDDADEHSQDLMGFEGNSASGRSKKSSKSASL